MIHVVTAEKGKIKHNTILAADGTNLHDLNLQVEKGDNEEENWKALLVDDHGRPQCTFAITVNTVRAVKQPTLIEKYACLISYIHPDLHHYDELQEIDMRDDSRIRLDVSDAVCLGKEYDGLCILRFRSRSKDAITIKHDLTLAYGKLMIAMYPIQKARLDNNAIAQEKRKVEKKLRKARSRLSLVKYDIDVQTNLVFDAVKKLIDECRNDNIKARSTEVAKEYIKEKLGIVHVVTKFRQEFVGCNNLFIKMEKIWPKYHACKEKYGVLCAPDATKIQVLAELFKAYLMEFEYPFDE